MNAKEAIEKIKQVLFNDAIPPAPVAPVAPVALATEYKLADGTAVSIDKLEVGGIVTIAGAVAPDGLLALEDGTSITIAGGVISAVAPAAPAQDTPVDMGQFAEEFAAFKAEFTTHKEAFSKVQADFTAANETIGRQDQAIKGLLEVVEGLAKTPIAQPIEEPVEFEKMTPLQKFRATKV